MLRFDGGAHGGSHGLSHLRARLPIIMGAQGAGAELGHGDSGRQTAGSPFFFN